MSAAPPAAPPDDPEDTEDAEGSGDPHAPERLWRRLPVATRRQVAALVEEVLPGHRLVGTRVLRGGLWASSHVLRLAEPGGGARDVVLRRYVRWSPGDEPDAECQRHAVLLPLLAEAGVPVPPLLWADASGERLGAPALLVERLPGRADVRPAATPAGARALGAALAHVHAVPAPRAALEQLGARPLSPRLEQLVQGAPEWSPSAPGREVVLEAIRAGWRQAAAAGDVLRHGDFHVGNVLWSPAGAVTAVLDWDVAGLAPAGADLGYCRLDLAAVHGPDAADDVAAGYAAAGGRASALPFWDLVAWLAHRDELTTWLPQHRALGAAPVTPEEALARADALKDAALAAAGGSGSH